MKPWTGIGNHHGQALTDEESACERREFLFINILFELAFNEMKESGYLCTVKTILNSGLVN